jgi:hypothetical protein
MSTKGFSFQKSEKGVPFEWRKRPSSDNSHEEHPQLSNVSEQAPGINRLLGIWLSALALFMARLLLVPLQRTHQPFYKRFLWAALMVCLPKSTLKDGRANASSSKRPSIISNPRNFATNERLPEQIRLPYVFCPSVLSGIFIFWSIYSVANMISSLGYSAFASLVS